MKRALITTAAIAALGLVSTSCELSDPDMDTCCECLLNTAPDGSATTDGAANCYADDGDGDVEAETESCANTSTAMAVAGAAFDDGVNVAVLNDGCRESCFDACTAVDETVSFETPVISSGTFEVTQDGTTKEATFVLTGIQYGAGEGGTDMLEIRATVDDGDWVLQMSAVDGAGTYPIAPMSNFGVSTPATTQVVDGSYNVSNYDGRTMDVTFSVNFTTAASATGSASVDFTVNDGDETGWVGLDANSGGDDE
jgi:hypothetical protein